MIRDLLELVGNTPLVRFRSLFVDSAAEVVAKLEYFNLTGSVKMRIALGLIREAERTGALKRGGTLVESTSGNTGIGVALAGTLLGYRVVVVVTDRVPRERRNMMRALGAEVVVCPSDVDIDDERSYRSTVRRIVSERGAYHLNQNDNPANPLTHYRTTAVEIWEQTDGRVTHLVAGIGTGGTITGIGRFLKEKNPNMKVIGVEPEGSIFRNAFYGEEMHKKRSLINGIGETEYIPKNVDFSVYDDVVQISEAEAFLTARRLASEEGIVAGGSGGAAVAAALRISPKLSSGDMMLLIIPDTGIFYLSTIYDDDWMREHGFLPTGS